MMHVKFAVIESPPNSYPCSFNSSSSCFHSGMAFEMALITCQYLNLNCTFTRFDPLEYGDYDEKSGNATGLIGAIYRGEYDTTLPVLTPTYTRAKVVSFSSAFLYEDVILVTRTPTKTGINWNVVYTFQIFLWIVMLISLILLSLLITLIQVDLISTPGSIILNIIKNALSLLCRQYHIVHLKCSRTLRLKNITSPGPLRFLVTSWALAYLVLASAYTGELFSEKMTGETKPPFTDLDTLVDCVVNGKCQMVAPTLSWSPLQFVMAKENRISGRLTKALEKNPIRLYPDTNETPSVILQEKNRYLVWITGRRYFSSYLKQHENEECSFYVITLPYNNNCAFAVRKNSTILRKLNEIANLYRESGIFEKIESTYLSGESSWNQCQKRSSEDNVTVLFSEIATVVIFYAVGNILAVIVLLFEMSNERRAG